MVTKWANQVLCTLPEVGQRYDGSGTEVFKTAPEDVASDFPAQVHTVISDITSSSSTHDFSYVAGDAILCTSCLVL